MVFSTLISAQEVVKNLNNPTWAIVDCRFALTDTEQGWRDYQTSHIAGAIYAHLDEDLSGSIIPGKTSRHPLPTIETFAQTLSGWGIDADTQVVAYDSMGGAIAARLWWMLHWMGHRAVAVLDGGWSAWQKDSHPTRDGVESREARNFNPMPRPELLVQANDVLQIGNDPNHRLFDSRSEERYRGENETLDPVGGHIPGAQSLPFAANLDDDGRFRPPEDLRLRFQQQVDETPAENTVFYCGSGVTAAHNILAMAHAGLGHARLYAGSWSEWITDPDRPVETG